MKTFLIAVFIGISHLMFGQNIGVQVNVNLLPPYTLSLHDYTQSGSNKLLVSVLLKDLNYPTYQAKLRVTIEGNGFTLTTRVNYIPPAINLQGGIPVVLTPEDLQPYFLPENLDFNGLNKSEYLRTRKLPEGFYRFFIEVLDYNRSSLVSNKGMAMAYIVLNEPPVINLPANNTKLTANDPQNIFFNWTPRHLGSPNSAFTTLYEFRLYEIQPKGRNPYEAVRTQNPIYEAIPALTATSFNYNVGMPALIPGNQYAFTIRAIDRENRDLFKNNGYSEVYVFTWGDECKPPLKIAAEAVSGGGIDLKWKTEPAHTGYNIQYRIKGNGSWLTQNSFIENASIYELPGNSEIEYQLQSVCGGYLSEYSPIQTIRTRKEEKRAFACGSGKTMPQITNTHPKPTLKIGDQFTAGGYTASITKISGQNGVFTGECHVLVPFFNLARVPHKFENIKINELNQMFEGKLVSIYNPDSKFLARVDGVTTPDGEKEYVMETGLGKISVDSTISVKGEITSVQVNTSGELVIVSEDGETTVITTKEGEKTLVTDEKGNQYLAENGSVTQVTTAGGNPGSSIPDNMTQLVNNPDSVKKTLPLLRFAPATQMVYGFDSLKYAELNKQYITQVIREQNYAIPFKAVATGSIDYVDILLPPQDTYDPSKVRYTMNNVPVMNSPSTGKNKRTLNVTSLSTGDIQSLDATYTLKDSTGKTNTETLGKLNVVAYNKVIKKVYLVPLNQTSSLNALTVKSALNRIYAQAVIELDVTMQDPFFNDAWNINNDNIFDDTDTDDHMNYTPAMRALKNAFKKEKSPEKDAIYIFLINAPHKNDLAGYMPFNAQFGFVFTQGVSNEAIAHTIAHELGHGAFKLRHTFSDKNTYILSQNTTENLMDYKGGTELNKYQWDEVHDRDLGVNWFVDEAEGEMSDNNCKLVFTHRYNDCPKRHLNYPGYSSPIPVPYEENWPKLSCKPTYWVKLGEGTKMGDEYDDKGKLKQVPVLIKISSPVSLSNFNELQTSEGLIIDGVSINKDFGKSIPPIGMYEEKVTNWIIKHWARSTDARLQTALAVESLAKAILVGGELNPKTICGLENNKMYEADYISKDQRQSDKVYYNSDEIAYWLWGYVAPKKFNFHTYQEALAFGMKYLDKQEYNPVRGGIIEDTPWKVKAILEGWMSAFNTYYDANINYTMTNICQIPSDHLIDGVGFMDVVEVSLWVYTGGIANSTKKISVKLGTKMLTSAYINWQVSILVQMIGGLSFEEAVKSVDYADVAWKGMIAPIKNEDLSGGLDCMNAMIDKFEKSKEFNFTTGIDMSFSCLVELGKSKLFEKIIKDPNSQFSIWLKEQFKNKTLRNVQEALMKNLGCTYQDTYEIMRLIPAQILDTLLKG